MFWAAVDMINNQYKSDHDLEVIEKLSWEFEGHCNVMF